jgi:NAD(P)H-flavin reductase
MVKILMFKYKKSNAGGSIKQFAEVSEREKHRWPASYCAPDDSRTKIIIHIHMGLLRLGD